MSRTSCKPSCAPRSAAYIDGLRQGVALRLTGADIINPFASGAQRGLHITECYSSAFFKRTGRLVSLHNNPQALKERLIRGRTLATRIIAALQEKV